jgi:surfactin synthase thioesterase subunit
MPVYICGGQSDGIATPAGFEALREQIPDARLEFFEGGHPFFIQAPRAVERIGAFLRRELDD